jgi:hypothetical protein
MNLRILSFGTQKCSSFSGPRDSETAPCKHAHVPMQFRVPLYHHQTNINHLPVSSSLYIDSLAPSIIRAEQPYTQRPLLSHFSKNVVNLINLTNLSTKNFLILSEHNSFYLYPYFCLKFCSTRLKLYHKACRLEVFIFHNIPHTLGTL